ncbi:hypothetical protein, partial [Chryseobacterium sp.]|uniref:hypothetical protein n=1 Tax=Chryseobacterium sp. TaxID=1871047 RepID=UPI0028A13785
NITIPITAIPATLLTGTLSLNTTGSAAKLTTPRTITVTGDGSWSVTFDGSANVSSALTLSDTGVTPGTYNRVSVDSKGRVTAGTNVAKTYPITISGSANLVHNLNTLNVEVLMRDTVTLYRVYGRIKPIDAMNLGIEFDSTPPNPISVIVTNLDI